MKAHQLNASLSIVDLGSIDASEIEGFLLFYNKIQGENGGNDRIQGRY